MDIRIIDCHSHFGRCFQARVEYPDDASMLRAMDAAGVKKLCVTSFLGIGPDCLVGNDLVADAVKRYPDRFSGYGTVNPNRPDEVEPELDRCFTRLGMKAIKLHPAWHGYSFEVSAYRKVFEFAAARRIPILSHELGNPDFLEGASKEYPEINFIIAHTAFWDGRSDFPFAGVFERRLNLFIDLVYSNIFYGALERMVTQVGTEKILLGSDFPL